jgi:large subunit ribosomal protein L25
MSAQQLTVAKELPPRLIRFFQRYPPPALFPNLTSAAATPQTTAQTISTTPPSDPNAPVTETSATELPFIPSTAPRNSRIPAHAHDLPYPNPFLPSKNFTTGRWHGPVFGLRKQADLVKLAVQHDVVDLLPWTIKKPGEKDARRIESGLMVKGTGEGQKVKGKNWERTLKGRLEMRRQAMLNMPQMIQEWKQVSYGLTRDYCLSLANKLAERTWPRMEEVAQRAGEEISYPKLHWVLPWTAHVPRFFVYNYSVWSRRIYERSFGHMFILWERTVVLCKSSSISVNPPALGRLRERSLGILAGLSSQCNSELNAILASLSPHLLLPTHSTLENPVLT